MMLDWKAISEVMNKVKEIIKSTGQEIPASMDTQIQERADSIFNPIEAMDADQVKIYNEFKSLKEELNVELERLKTERDNFEKKMNKAKNLENFFTSQMELKHDLSGKMWRVNEKTGMIEVFDQERAIKEMQAMGIHMLNFLNPNDMEN